MDFQTRVDATIDKAIAEDRIVGAVLIVARDGEIIYRRAAGHFDRAQALAIPGGNEPALYRALHNRGVLHVYRGEIEAALGPLAAARDGWRRLELPGDEVETLLRIGNAYLEAGAGSVELPPSIPIQYAPHRPDPVRPVN